IYILRWFWWRVNAFSEITGMVVSFAVAIFFKFFYAQLGFQPLEGWQELIIGVALTTLAWIIATMVTPATDMATLRDFYLRIRPDGFGWQRIRASLEADGVLGPNDGQTQESSLAAGIRAMAITSFLVYALLFGTGFLLYGQYVNFAICAVVVVVAIFLLRRTWPALRLGA
ncbi:MAG: Na+:solute symporter, partial [Planctomycetota bacterium]